MADVATLRRPRTLPRGALLALIPVGAAVVGLLVRYLAYAVTVDQASLAGFADDLCIWDCEWYVRLAEQGYDRFPTPSLLDAGNWAFFPLLPLLVAALRTLSGLPTVIVAMALSIALAIGAARLAWSLLGRDLHAYALFSVFLLAGPVSVYFTTFYTEVLFLFLTICVFWALERRRFLLAGAFAALLSATRMVGVLIVFAILVEAWLEHRERGGTWRDFVPAVLRRPDLVLCFALAPLGFFAYMAYLHFHMGDALAFQHVQRAWGRPFGNPLLFLWDALSTPPEQGILPSSAQLLGVVTLIGYALSLVLLLRRRYAMGVYCLICLTLPLFAGMASMLRFVAGLAPLPMLACELLARPRWSFAAALVLLLAGGWFGTVAWLTGNLALV